jgi:tetratricopeptide (TPR) repeat protein
LFERCLELAPNDPVAELDLAKTFIDMGLVDAGLNLIGLIHEHAAANPQDLARLDPLDLVRAEATAHAEKSDFAQADRLLTAAHDKNPKDEYFCGVMADFYQKIGYSLLRQSGGDAAKERDAAKWFQKSLTACDERLQLLNGPMQVTAKAQEIPKVNLQKAETQMMLKQYDEAIATLTAMVRQDPDNPVPLLNRAISELQSNRLDAAKKDYLALEKMVPEPSHMIYYGLGQIAQKQNDKAAEIRYDKLYLQYAPANTAEFTNVTQQLHKLEGR